jgi:hypothetical protein
MLAAMSPFRLHGKIGQERAALVRPQRARRSIPERELERTE